jgi:D-alanine--poly(phosphoribitol) ligase subunit 2
MEEEIIKIIEEVSGYKGLKENIDIDLLENEILDSLSFIELISSLEDIFNIEIQPTQVESSTWRKVGSIVKLVESLK